MSLLNHFWFGTQLASITEQGNRQEQSPERPLPPDTPVVAPSREAGENLSYTVTSMSDWGAGYCVDVAVRNTGIGPLEWQFHMPAEGQINNIWNAEYKRQAEDISVQGADWNRQLAAGAETHFGYCAKREAPDAGGELASADAGRTLETVVSIRSRWQTGYCAEITVRNTGSQSVDWRVKLNIRGRIDNLWRGEFTQGADTITVQGKDYNRRIEAGQSESFGFCARL